MSKTEDLPPDHDDDDSHVDEIETSSFTPPLEAVCMAFIGEPRSGKSTLIKKVMQYYATRKYFHFGLVISGSAWNGDYDFLPSKSVWSEWNEDKLKHYLSILEERAHMLHKKKKGGKLPPSFLVLDDLLGQINNSDFFKSFLSRYRQYNITVMIAAQYAAEAKGCSTLFRSVCDVAFLFPTLMHNSLEAMFKAFGGYYKSLDEFKEVMKEVKSRPHACLVFQKKKTSRETAYISLLCDPAPKSFKMKFVSDNKNVNVQSNRESLLSVDANERDL